MSEVSDRLSMPLDCHSFICGRIHFGTSSALCFAYFWTYIFTLELYCSVLFICSWAASAFRGSDGLGYNKSYGRKTSKMLTRSYIGDHAWLITSKHTEPDLKMIKPLAV